LLFAWTGNIEIAEWGHSILFWFSLGNGILTVTAFQYYLQKSYGNVRLQVIGSTLAVIVQVPIIYFSAIHYGALGVAIAWFSFRLIWFFIWTAIVHRSLIPGFHLRWLTKDIAPIAVVSLLVVVVLRLLLTFSLDESRVSILIQLMFSGVLTLLITFIASSFIRGRIMNALLSWKKDA